MANPKGNSDFLARKDVALPKGFSGCHLRGSGSALHLSTDPTILYRLFYATLLLTLRCHVKFQVRLVGL